MKEEEEGGKEGSEMGSEGEIEGRKKGGGVERKWMREKWSG